MKLSKRLQAVFNYINPCYAVADIGTDHAYLPIKLVKDGICKKAIASDVILGPLEIAKSNIRDYRLSEQIDVVLSNGIENIAPDDVSQFIISGMGGITIKEILEKALNNKYINKIFILQPMNSRAILRTWLFKNGFSTIKEKIVLDNKKFYHILMVVYNKKTNLQELDFFKAKFGVKMEVDEDYIYYLKNEIRKYNNIINSLNQSEYKYTDEIKNYRILIDYCTKLLSKT